MFAHPHDQPGGPGRQRRVLLIVLLLNGGLAGLLAVAGLLADSSALVANALDNASDAVVYLISWLAVGRAAAWKVGAARLSGWMLVAFSLVVLADVARRLVTEVEPLGATMMALALVAAAVNLVCLWLIRHLHAEDVNLRAAETFSFNDFVSNGGVLLAGGLVIALGRPWPDLVVGAAVAAVALKGGLEILADARKAGGGGAGA